VIEVKVYVTVQVPDGLEDPEGAVMTAVEDSLYANDTWDIIDMEVK
jgi:phosphoribosylformylglycinamidine (FGAM) synthase PurS component